jgi:hypothetical protein
MMPVLLDVFRLRGIARRSPYHVLTITKRTGVQRAANDNPMGPIEQQSPKERGMWAEVLDYVFACHVSFWSTLAVGYILCRLWSVIQEAVNRYYHRKEGKRAPPAAHCQKLTRGHKRAKHSAVEDTRPYNREHHRPIYHHDVPHQNLCHIRRDHDVPKWAAQKTTNSLAGLTLRCFRRAQKQNSTTAEDVLNVPCTDKACAQPYPSARTIRPSSGAPRKRTGK